MIVIIGCLGAQTYAVVRPSGARLYPFLSYPMYSRSRPPGETRRVRELWARTCDDPPRAWKVEPRTLGYQDDHFLGEPGAVAGDRPDAPSARARLGNLARARLRRRPCVLELWERTIPTTRDGVDASALRRPQRVRLRVWPVSDPAAVRASPSR